MEISTDINQLRKEKPRPKGAAWVSWPKERWVVSAVVLGVGAALARGVHRQRGGHEPVEIAVQNPLVSEVSYSVRRSLTIW